MTGDRIEIFGLFKNKVLRLEDLLRSDDPFDTIEMAGLCRDLLISDGEGLFGLLLKAYPELRTRRDKRLIFAVRHVGSTEFNREERTRFPDGTNNKICNHPELTGTVNYTMRDFLNLPVICISGDHYNFRDIVKFVANKLGARHFDFKSNDDRQEILREIRKNFGVEDFDPILIPVKEKAPVVVRTGLAIIHRLNDLHVGK